jgi:hypothetical protein
MAGSTLLTLSPIGVPPYSCRGMTQTLDPIEGAIRQRRESAGALFALTLDQMKKYRSRIAGRDQDPPAFDGLWPGAVLVVGCLAELAFLTATAGLPTRTVVAGTLRTEGPFTFYRPQLTMLVRAFNLSTPEWGAETAWSLDLEEQ